MKTKIMSKANYTVEDFILDSEFRKWILGNHPEAKRYWEDFMRTHPEKVPEIELARKILIHLSREKSKMSPKNKEGIWEAISSKLEDDSARESKVVNLDSWTAIQQYNQELAKKKRVAWKRKAAAVLVLLGTLAFFLAEKLKDQDVTPAPVLAELEVLQAPPGVKSTISLEDGSKVFLNSGSKITYQKGFTDSLRLLTLEGEAYFEVAHDQSRPFTVQTGGISTTALGTSFNICSFPGDSISISLVTGVVLVKNEESTVAEKLMPGEGIRASVQDMGWRKNRFDLEQVLSWMNKTLIFNQTPFAKASSKLENWFGVEIAFENQVPKDLMVSGKFVDESLENILKGLSYSSRFKYSIQGKKVLIQFKS